MEQTQPKRPRAPRPWWKKRRVRYLALLCFGATAPFWCSLLPWPAAQGTCEALGGVARVLAGGLPLPAVMDDAGADGGT